MIGGAAGKLFSQVAAGSRWSLRSRGTSGVEVRPLGSGGTTKAAMTLVAPFIHPGADRCDGLPGPFLGGQSC